MAFNFDPGELLPENLQIHRADSHLYRVGLSLFPPKYSFHRHFIYHPIVVFVVLLQQFLRDVSLLTLDIEATDDCRIKTGGVDWFLNTGSFGSQVCSLTSLLGLICQGINLANYK